MLSLRSLLSFPHSRACMVMGLCVASTASWASSEAPASPEAAFAQELPAATQTARPWQFGARAGWNSVFARTTSGMRQQLFVGLGALTLEGGKQLTGNLTLLGRLHLSSFHVNYFSSRSGDSSAAVLLYENLSAVLVRRFSSRWSMGAGIGYSVLNDLWSPEIELTPNMGGGFTFSTSYHLTPGWNVSLELYSTLYKGPANLTSAAILFGWST